MIALYTDTDVSSWMYWFVLPVGAGLVGAVAASGYYFASLLTQRPPTPRLALNMVLIGLSTYAFMQYLTYHALTMDDGTPVANLVPFWTYYRVKIEHTSLQMMRLRGVSTGELGGLGYLYEALKVIGFMLGGAGVYAYLSEKSYCGSCKRYFNTEKLCVIGVNQIDDKVDQINQALASGDSLRAFVEGEAKRTHEPHVQLAMDYCSRCFDGNVLLKVMRNTGNGFEEIRSHRQTIKMDRAVVSDMVAAPRGGERQRPTTPAPESLPAPAERPPTPPEPVATQSLRPTVEAARPTSHQAAFHCWSCKAVIEVRSEQRGKKVTCPQCGTKQMSPPPA